MDSEMHKQQYRRRPRFSLGDLNSGHAFDNSCICFIDNLQTRECVCDVRIVFVFLSFTNYD